MRKAGLSNFDWWRNLMRHKIETMIAWRAWKEESRSKPRSSRCYLCFILPCISGIAVGEAQALSKHHTNVSVREQNSRCEAYETELQEHRTTPPSVLCEQTSVAFSTDLCAFDSCAFVSPGSTHSFSEWLKHGPHILWLCCSVKRNVAFILQPPSTLPLVLKSRFAEASSLQQASFLCRHSQHKDLTVGFLSQVYMP